MADVGLCDTAPDLVELARKKGCPYPVTGTDAASLLSILEYFAGELQVPLPMPH